MAEVAATHDHVLGYAPPHGIALEEARFDGRRGALSAAPEIRFWQQFDCVVTTTAMARHAAFPWANERSRSRGWPVALRRSGGGTVFHGPGVLCISMTERLPTAEANVETAYHRLCRVIIGGLNELGVEATHGPLPSAPCDGRFNILVGGRKIAGTAARMRFGSGGTDVLLHASLNVAGDHFAGVEAVQRFESDLGLESHYPPSCMTGLSEIIAPVSVGRCAEAIARAYSHFNQEDPR